MAMSRRAFVGNSALVAHELGHTFGLDHDFRKLGHRSVSILGGDFGFLHDNIMTKGPWYARTLRLSKCADESTEVVFICVTQKMARCNRKSIKRSL